MTADVFQMDATEFLSSLEPGTVDVIFADPPFNVGKDYGPNSSDDRNDYIEWCREWIGAGARALKPGGAFWQYNIPRNNIEIAPMMIAAGLDFRHSVAVDWTASPPCAGRLIYRHQSLLYFTKGRPGTFNRPRTAVQTCRHCGGDVKDYGGKKKDMHPDGVAVGDVWSDIFPVMHRGRKHRQANELPEALLERVLEISSEPGDLVVDPFVGTGTTAVVAQRMMRRFMVADVADVSVVIDRLDAQTQDRQLAFASSSSNHFGEFCADVYPNVPPCEHGDILHDRSDDEDPSPTCCAEGCQCGGRTDLIRTEPQERPVTDGER